MSYKCMILAPGADAEKALQKLTDEFSQLYGESWERDKKQVHDGKQYSVNIQALFDLWFRGALKIFLCVNGAGEKAGYLMGMQFRPLTHNSNVFQVEDWYARGVRAETRDEIVEQMFDFLKESLDIMSVDELWISHGDNETYPVFNGWKESGGTMTDRYIRE